MTESKKLETSQNTDSKLFNTTKKHSYFVLSGNLYIYEKENKEEGKRKKSYED